MTTSNPLTLVLGATGRTGSRVAANLIKRGLPVRTAARSGADVSFDWSQRSSYRPALESVRRVYLMAPVLRVDYADDVAAFLDQAEAVGVEHVTYLSAFGMEHAPDQVAPRAVELDLQRRKTGHTILRPSWFMQNFSESFLKPIDRAIIVPTGDGAEAFIDVDDIAAVAAITLADPQAHSGEAYSLTGPEALTVAEVAAILSDVTGQQFSHVDLDRDAWITGAIATGVPEAYGAVLRQLTETVASGHGAIPNGTVEKLTCRPPGTFRQFAAENAAVWKDAS